MLIAAKDERMAAILKLDGEREGGRKTNKKGERIGGRDKEARHVGGSRGSRLRFVRHMETDGTPREAAAGTGTFSLELGM
jgi:hypothetical protein